MIRRMLNNPIIRFIVFWGVNTLSLWVADELFGGLSFGSARALFIAGLMLGIVNAVVKPLLSGTKEPRIVLELDYWALFPRR